MIIDKLKILVLTEDFLPIYGGLSSVVAKSSLALSKHADLIIGTVAVPKNKSANYKPSPAPYKVITCRGFYNKITTNMQAFVNLDKKFRREIEKQRYDLIHCHLPLSLYKYGLKLGKKTNTPVIITAHSFLYPDFKYALKFKLFASALVKFIVKRLNRADEIFCVTKFCKNNLIKHGLRREAKVVYNAVEMNEDDKNLIIDFEKKYKFDKDTFIITVVGRLVKVKNIPILIKAIALLKSNNLNIKLLIIGDGSERKNIQKLIKKYNLKNFCVLTGAIIDRSILSALYKRSNLIAFLSIGDAAGLIQTESAYFEKPTLAIENTAISELMIDRENGLIVKNNVEDIANKILYAYNNKEELINIGKRAKKTLYRSYFNKNVTEEILNNYKEVIEKYKNK